jgi:predicted nucleic acid-binding Zn ribbon protein
MESNHNQFNTQSIGAVLKTIIKNSNLQSKLDETTIINQWEEIVGALIARHTNDLYIKNRKLFVKFDSSALKQEMSYSKSLLLEKINQQVDHQAIDEIILL